MELGHFFFKNRGVTPFPLIFLMAVFGKPTPNYYIWGAGVMTIGELVRLVSVAYAGCETRSREVGASQLVTDGPYAYVRNPLYIANIIMYAGAVVVANIWLPWFVLLVLMFFAFQYHHIVRLEERCLLALFGEVYRDYCRRVPSFIPRLSPSVPGRTIIPDYKMAFRSEKSSLLSYCGILVFFFLKMIY